MCVKRKNKQIGTLPEQSMCMRENPASNKLKCFFEIKFIFYTMFEVLSRVLKNMPTLIQLFQFFMLSDSIPKHLFCDSLGG